MANDYMDHFEINGVDVYIQDHGRDQPNGVPVLDPQGKLPIRYIPDSYANDLLVSPEDPYQMSFTEWVTTLSSAAYKNKGKEWTQIEDSTALNLRQATCGNGVWVIATTTGLFWSENLTSWSQCVDGLSNPLSNYFNVVHYANGLYVAAKGTGYSGVYWSIDGKTWTQGTGIVTANEARVGAINYANGVWLIGDVNGYMWRSTNGKDWQTARIISTSIGFAPIYAEGLWVVGTYDGLWWSDDEGVTWIRGSITSAYTFTAVVYSNGLWAAGSNSHGLYWSADGKNWTQVSTASSYTFTTIDCTEGLWVAGSNSHGLYQSIDGKNWTQITSVLSSVTIKCVRYADGRWIACSASSGLWWSDDGTIWTQTNITSGQADYAEYGNGVWLASLYSQNNVWSGVPVYVPQQVA